MRDFLVAMLLVAAIVSAVVVGQRLQADVELPQPKSADWIAFGDLFGERWIAYEVGDSRHMIKWSSITAFYTDYTHKSATVFFGGGKLFNTIQKEDAFDIAVAEYEQHIADHGTAPGMLDVLREIDESKR